MDLIQFLEKTGGKPDSITWNEVGDKFGITGNAASKRWGKHQRDAEKVVTEVADDGPPSLEGMIRTKARETSPGKWVSSWELIQEDVEEETLVQKIEQSFQRILEENHNKLPRPDLPKITSSQNTLIVVVSDIHVGSRIDENVMFEVSYDEDVFRGRMNQVLEFILRKRGLNKKPFENFILFDLGDSLDGHDGKTTRGTSLPQNMDTAQQWETYVDVMINLWKGVISNEVAANYEFVGASCSNHGGQMDYIAMQSVGKIIQNIFDIDYFVSRKFMDLKIVESNGVKYSYVFTHGKDDRDRKHGLSLTLDAKTREYVQGVIDGWGVPNTKNTIVLKGDLHQSAYTRSHNRWHYVSCPSVFGSSGHAINNYTATEPGFYFEVLDGEDRMTGVKDFK